LRQAAHRWQQEQKIVRPGRTTLRDVIGTALETALENAYIQLSNTLAPGQAEKNGCARLRVAQSKVSLNGGFRADVPNTRVPATTAKTNDKRRTILYFTCLLFGTPHLLES
jgi:hypothetical protein